MKVVLRCRDCGAIAPELTEAASQRPCFGCGARVSVDLWLTGGPSPAWVTDLGTTTWRREDALAALSAFRAAAARLPETNTHARSLAGAIASWTVPGPAPEPRATPPQRRERPPKAKASKAASPASARGTAPPLTRPAGGLLGAVRRPFLVRVGILVGLPFLIAIYVGVSSGTGTSHPTPAEVRAEQRARCGDLSPLRCRYSRACAADDANACFRYGLAEEVGNGGPIDVASAMTRYEKGCRLGSGAACHALASLYRNGHGVSADPARAAALDQDACRHGFRDACTPGAP